ncbi:hypothetical protein VNO78_29041 [Psophocarpus tetragonolobus]|uniref:Uncharacterized protein n=1 Tax=Psophocarpus tetragonolobus TaxID=3891 RepID=A0AAN9RUN6_PSOTE
MKSKTICFCLRGSKSKSKEGKVEDLEKLSHAKAGHKGRKTKGSILASPIGDDGSINVHGAKTGSSNDAGVAAAVMTAAHMSLMSANEVQNRNMSYSIFLGTVKGFLEDEEGRGERGGDRGGVVEEKRWQLSLEREDEDGATRLRKK